MYIGGIYKYTSEAMPVACIQVVYRYTGEAMPVACRYTGEAMPVAYRWYTGIQLRLCQ